MTRQNRLNWFQAVKQAQPQSNRAAFDLLLETELDEASYKDMKAATVRFVQACFSQSGDFGPESDVVTLLNTHIDQLANRTDSGVLMPKREFEDEFNDLNRAVSSYLQRMGIDHLINSVSGPILVRTVNGTADPVSESRPTATTKMHVDPWNGDPGDLVIVTIPMLGDIERTTVEYCHPPDDFEARLLRSFDSYDAGIELLGQVDPYPVHLKHGYAYLVDAIVPHRTIQQRGGTRLNLELRLRRKTTDEERMLVEEADRFDRLAHYINPSDWYSLSATKRMQFLDTYADAKRGVYIQKPFNQRTYNVVDA